MALLQKYAPPAIRLLSGEKNGNAIGIRFVTAASVAGARKAPTTTPSRLRPLSLLVGASFH